MVGYQKYQINQVEGSGPLGLVLLTYESLYKSLIGAYRAVEASDYAEEAHHTSRALEAIIELSSSLNFEKGKDISINLANLYKYMMDQLAGNMCSGDTRHLQEVMDLVQTLREAWQAIDSDQKKSTVKLTNPPQHAKTYSTKSLAYAYSG